MNQDFTYTVCQGCSQVNRVSVESPHGKKPVCGNCKAQLDTEDGVSELSASAVRTLSEKSPVPVIVDFWAPWCQPCRVFTPVFKQAARQFAGQFVFAKVDTQANPLAGDYYQIRGVPTLVIFKNGTEVTRLTTAMPFNTFVQWIQRSVA